MDGRFNHAVYVSTKQTNSADSAASNIGFRCASSGIQKTATATTTATSSDHVEVQSLDKETHASGGNHDDL